MYPNFYYPKPLRTMEFYVLMALDRSPMHAYGIIGAVLQDSLGSVKLASGKLYPLLTRLCEEGLIEVAGTGPAGKSGKERLLYQVSEHGQIRLQEEALRLRHAVEVMKDMGMFENTVPTDIRRLLLDARSRPQK